MQAAQLYTSLGRFVPAADDGWHAFPLGEFHAFLRYGYWKRRLRVRWEGHERESEGHTMGFHAPSTSKR